MKYKLTENQYKILIETAKIQPWEGNPNQPDIPDDQITSWFKDDEESNQKYSLKGDSKIDRLSTFRDLDKISKASIDNLQKAITDTLQQRYMKEKGVNNPIVPYEEIGKIGNKKLDKDLANHGMKLEIAGKTFSFGNSKIPENTLIINLTSAFNCPSKLNGQCQWGNRCYAHALERMRDKVEARNLRNQFALCKLSIKEILKLVEAYIENAPMKIKYIRLHEDGDFKDQATLDFCNTIAGHLKAKYGIQTVAYTHRVLDYSNIDNITINGSSYDIKNCDRYFIPVSKKDYDKVPEGLDFSGKDIPMRSVETGKKVDTTHGTYKCPCDCRKCFFCYRTKEQNGEPANNAITIIETSR